MPERKAVCHKTISRFYQAKLKREWANKHINQLHATWEAFLKTDFCQLRLEDHSDGGQALRIISINPLPAELVLLLGDAVHNLRAALDYTVNEVLGWRDTRLTFPMADDREELITSFRTKAELVGGKTKKKGRNAAIEVAAAGIGKFIIDEIRPYKSGNGFLWLLNKLDGCDKHRLLIPVLVPQSITGLNVVDKNNNRVANITATVGPGGMADLIHFGIGGVTIEHYGKPTAEIFFNEAGIIEGQPVFPTLLQMSQAVSETINRIDAFLTSIGWSAPTK